MDTSSKEYKKALRHHRKSEQHKAQDSRSEPVSAFRAAEKIYKARFPPPDLGGVLDLAPVGEIRGSPDAVETAEVRLKDGKRGYLVERVPGLVLLPSFVSPFTQQSLVTRCLREHARSPNESNLDAHYIIPPTGLWNEWESVAKRRETESEFDITIDIKWKDGLNAGEYHAPDTGRTLVDNATGSIAFAAKSQPKLAPMPSSSLQPTPVSGLVPKLRWSNIGLNYHWGTKSYDFDRQKVPFPDDIRDICVDAVKNVNWREIWEGVELADGLKWDDGEDWSVWEHTYEPDAGIINFYQPKDTLMGHVDRSEISSTSPLVSISLGNSAVFLIGGTTRDVEPVPILLHSGDVIIMSGPGCRRAYHGVPRVLEGTTPSYLLETDPLIAEYIKNARINCNVRQVFPTHTR